ncbi:MAG: PAS domain S-box protein [Proteobacteria bacterium]|nr:PAS domain S-box protein [Pseudomonadota bacterium]
MDHQYHSLLRRQLKKIFGEPVTIPEKWQRFIDAVDTAYKEFDTDRNMLERSLELSSQELLQANSEMRIIFEALPDLFFRLDYEGTILDCKAGNSADLYISREKIIGSKIFGIPVPEVGAKFKEAMQQVQNTFSTARMEYSIMFNGDEYFYEARLLPLLDNQIIVIIRNVTEQKRIENALKESEEKYRSIFENAVEGIFQTTTDGMYLNVNPALAKMYGFESPQGMIMSLTDIGKEQYVIPEDRLRFKTLIERTGTVQGFETQVYRKDMTKIWISVNAHAVKDLSDNTICYEGTIENITDRKLAEDALFESEDRYRSIVEESHFGVYIIQDGLFRFVNKKFCEIHGYEYSEIVDKLGPKDFLLPEDLPVVEESIRKRYSGELKSVELNYSIRHKNGELRPIKAVGGFIFYKGKPAIIGTLLDMSKERVLEQQLIQSQKMETVGRLAGGIAHDFNNILGIILGNTQLAKINLPPEDKTCDYLTSIEKATTRAADFVKQLLAFSRQQVLELKVVDLNAVTMSFEKMVRRVIGEHIEMSIISKPELPVIKADVAQINQILLNLVINARDAMPDGGKLSIDITTASISQAYCQYNVDAVPGDYVVLSVTDTGIGIRKDMLNKIFEPFFTTRKSGSGLGLSVVYGLVKQHGGFINVYSELDVGTTFKVFLPSIQETIEAVEETTKSIRGGNETILIVEDEKDLREIASEILQTLGYSVLLASNGEEGIEIYKEKPNEIHLVLLDVVMPKLGGRETYEEMKKIKPSVRPLFVTGYSLDGIHTNFILEEGIDAIQKPYSFETLASKIREIMDRKS